MLTYCNGLIDRSSYNHKLIICALIYNQICKFMLLKIHFNGATLDSRNVVSTLFLVVFINFEFLVYLNQLVLGENACSD